MCSGDGGVVEGHEGGEAQHCLRYICFGSDDCEVGPGSTSVVVVPVGCGAEIVGECVRAGQFGLYARQ